MSYERYSKPPTPNQIRCLRDLGIPPSQARTSYEAHLIIQDHREQWEKLPPTEGQRRALERAGLWDPCLNRGLANRLIGRLKEREGW